MCISQAREFYYCVGKINKQRRLAGIQVRWEKPPSNWFKLNTNGASCGNPRRAGGGGVIRDSAGKWVRGFARSIGSTTSIIAEFWALKDDLQLAIQLGVQYLEVELDAKVVLDVISFEKSPTAAYSYLLFDCKLLLEKIPHYTVKHVFREANRSAVALARMGYNLHDNLVFFYYPPSDVIAALVSADKKGETFCRYAANLAILVV